MATLRKRFGKQLQHLRKMRGMTQEELAEKAGLSWSHVNAIEGGRNSPSFDSLERLGRVLGATLKDLFGFPVPKESQRMRDPLTYLYELLQGLPRNELKKISEIVEHILALRRRR